ncbi:MAG: hypothetical protein ACKOC8_06375 [Pirellulales bacterium]
MAKTSSTVYQLSIALIVFVLLTFVLAITTYLFFKQRMDEQTKSQSAEQTMADKQAELLTAQEELQKLRAIVGEPEGTPAQAVEDAFSKLVTTDFNGFNQDPKTYKTLIAWLRQEFVRRDQEVNAAAEKVKAAEAAVAAAETKVAAAEQEKTEKVAAAAKAQTDDKQKFDSQWQDHEAELKKLLEQKRVAEERGDHFDLVVSRIADGSQYLSPARQRDFASREKPEDKLGVLYAELRDRAKALDEQNRVLASLRVADRDLQQHVLAATPKEDRIDGFDGRVLSVDEVSRTALISCQSTRGIRPGMVLDVFPPDDSRPQIGDRKGVVEVTEVEGPSLVRVAIRRDSIRTPILAGDAVATSLWAAGTAPEVAIVGYVNLDDAGGSDAARLAAFVARAGARVVDAVTPSTAMVVDGGKPPAQASDETKEAFESEARRQKRAIDSARQWGVRVVGVDAVLDMLGTSRQALAADRLPEAAGTR